MKLKGGPSAWFSEDVCERLSYQEAPLTHEVALATLAVVLPHRDPIDTFLVANAKVYGLTLVTADSKSDWRPKPARFSRTADFVVL